MMGAILNLLLVAAVVLLPVGTRSIITPGVLNNGPWEYGTLSVYASEVLIWLAFVVMVFRPLVSFLRRQESSPGSIFSRMGTCLRRCDKLKTGAMCFLLVVVGYFSFRGHNYGWLIHALSAVLLIVTLRRNREHIVSISAAFVAGVSVQVVLGLVQVIAQKVWSSTVLGMAGHVPLESGASVVGTVAGRFLRAYGTLPHPNVLGAYSVVGLALALWLLRYNVSSRMHGALIGSTAFFGIGAAISFSRAAWIAMALVLIVAGLTARRRSIHEKVSVMGSGLIAIAGLTMCFIFWRSAVIPRLFLKTDFTVPGKQVLEERSITERIGSMKEGLRVIEKHSLVGVGGGNYTRAVHDELDSARESWNYQPAHNTFLLVIAELGLVGFSMLALVVALSKPRFGLGLLALIPFVCTDHFLWSLWPGLALLAFVIGVAKPSSVEALDKPSHLS